MPLDDQGRTRTPINNEAEQALLAAILSKNSTYDEIAGLLKPEHFAEEMHAAIFEAFERDAAAGKRVSAVTLANEFDRQYLGNLAGSVVTTINNRHYAEIIIDCWRRRELGAVADDIVLSVAAGGKPLLETQEEIEQRLAEIFTGAEERGLVALSDALHPAIARVEEASKHKGSILGVPTGIYDLDRALGGMMPGELYILAGRPAMGKSTSKKTIELAAARAGHVVADFTLEMSTDQMAQWFLADPTGISASRMRRGEVEEYEMDILVGAVGDMHGLPIYIDDTAALSIAQIRARAKRLKRQKGLSLITVDHIGLVSATRAAQERGDTSAMTEIAKGLKALAKDLHVPVLALSQLSRKVEERDNKRPTLSDLRQSGEIEQSADVVIFVYRDEYYLTKNEPKRKSGEDKERFAKKHLDWQDELESARGLCELIIAKQRSGPESTVTVKFEPENSRVANYTRRG